MTKIVFKTPAKFEGKYLNSPFYKGTLMWNNLSRERQTVDSVLQFKNVLNGMYDGYQEIW